MGIRTRLGRALVALAVSSMVLAVPELAAAADPTPVASRVPQTVITLDPSQPPGRADFPEPDPDQVSIASSTITVNYSGFTPTAQTAFQFAVDLLEGIVNSPVPIVVNAQYTSSGFSSPNQLGSAGPASGFQDQPAEGEAAQAEHDEDRDDDDPQLEAAGAQEFQVFLGHQLRQH